MQHVKYLGVIIDSQLTWKEHIKITTHKANTALSFLRRNLKSCYLYIKTKCYLGTVRPIIEYACTVWAPHTAQDINKIEMIQRRAARSSTIILLAFPTCSNYLAGPLYKQEDTTLSCY